MSGDEAWCGRDRATPAARRPRSRVLDEPNALPLVVAELTPAAFLALILGGWRNGWQRRLEALVKAIERIVAGPVEDRTEEARVGEAAVRGGDVASYGPTSRNSGPQHPNCPPRSHSQELRDRTPPQDMPGPEMEPVPVTRPTWESIVKLIEVSGGGYSSPDGERPWVGAARPASGRVAEGQGHDAPAVHDVIVGASWWKDSSLSVGGVRGVGFAVLPLATPNGPTAARATATATTLSPLMRGLSQGAAR